MRFVAPSGSVRPAHGAVRPPLSSLATGLRERAAAREEGALEDLQEAVSFHQEAVTLMQGSIELPGVLTEFGMSLHGLAAATQDLEVASQARGVLRDAVEAGLEDRKSTRLNSSH